MQYTVIRYMSFVVISSHVPNSNACKGLKYTYHSVVSQNDRFVFATVALHSDLSCNSKPHKEMSLIVEQLFNMQKVHITTSSFDVMDGTTHKCCIIKRL